ncbi:Gfo/Idh/MocA family oxidoreductase [Nodosilinea sp. P-1105]|uniref:Gfo/Idh/MocA family oxidoreductase n=1 Tax=Nodosilinea sp. P-1105 TaxID=2546229 RepID=UPI00146D5885|nr:Gfo/Idh/MocA family oxidoreductase [Nodosilinea sp. P-1105]
MRIVFVGCGFVSDYYLKTLPLHPHLELIGCFDQDCDRADHLAKRTWSKSYNSLDDVLADANVDIVVNLTNPRSHYSITQAALMAGKHVYSEKPIAMTMAEAKELADLANQKNLQLSCAPCSCLSESAQTLWKALRQEVVGPVRLVYAEMDDGLVHKMPYQQWVSTSGIPWPFQDEFEVGCTLEHAGYYLTWLTMFFGPAASVTAFSSCLIPAADKHPEVTLSPSDTPDFSVACIKFVSGVVARLTCSIVAPHDHSLRIIGDQGIAGIDDCWYYGDPVYVQRMVKIRRKVFMSPVKKKYPLVRRAPKFNYNGAQQMDFCRGVAEMAEAITEGRPNRLATDFSLHNNELAIAIQNALETGCTYPLTTSFEPIQPMPWAMA